MGLSLIHIFNFDNSITRECGNEAKNVTYFSSKAVPDNGYCLKDNKIVFISGGEIQREVIDINDIYIPGMHNVENYMAAIAATDTLINLSLIHI